jgi:hypothetical protein
MRKLFTLALLGVSVASFGQADSDILLFDLKLKKSKVTLSNPKNITSHKGYDNQPSFHSEKPYIYYSSFNLEGRSDIKRFDMVSGETVHITTTNDREYSPTLTPDKQYLSCIIQRDNGAQDLGKYPVDGGEPTVIIDNLTVGYHLWADNSHLAMFILGAEGKPHTLHYMRLPTKEDTVLASNIGRSFHKIPGERSISFIQKGEAGNKIMKLNTETMEISAIADTMNKGEDIAWTQDGKIITSDGTKLFFLDVSKASKGWMALEITGGAELLKSITRIAINPKGDKIAIVVAE